MDLLQTRDPTGEDRGLTTRGRRPLTSSTPLGDDPDGGFTSGPSSWSAANTLVVGISFLYGTDTVRDAARPATNDGTDGPGFGDGDPSRERASQRPRNELTGTTASSDPPVSAASPFEGMMEILREGQAWGDGVCRLKLVE